MKKKIIYLTIPILLIVSIILIVLFTRSNKLLGQWQISGFYVNDELHPFNEFGEYFGIDNAEPYSYYTVVFKNKEDLILTIPTYEEDKYRTIECNYSVDNDIITITSLDESVKAFAIDGDHLKNVDLLTFDVIWSKQ